MKTILFDSHTGKIFGRIYDGGYRVDGKIQKIDPPIYELQYIETVRPEIDPIMQSRSAVWVPDIVFKTYTQVWSVHNFSITELPSLSDAKAQKLSELKAAVQELYSTIQWYSEMCRAEGTAIPAAVTTKIKAIKTKYDQAKAAINALTTVSDVLHWQVPKDQINTIKINLEAII